MVNGILFLLCSVLYITACFADSRSKQEPRLFAAVAHMKPLVQIERRLVDIAKDYLSEQRKKLNELAPFARSVEEAMQMSDDDPERYLGNPINCYLIIKRFTSGWKELPSRLDIGESNLKGKVENLFLFVLAPN